LKEGDLGDFKRLEKIPSAPLAKGRKNGLFWNFSLKGEINLVTKSKIRNP
jgi:hypothetical protein